MGTEVLWENGGRNDHDMVPVDDGEEWGVENEAFHPGDTYCHVFTEPGSTPTTARSTARRRSA